MIDKWVYFMMFKEHLKRQLNYLERSCTSYDEGYHDESIRIATVIRVLTHDTKSSTSLLKYLRATSVNILSTTLEPSPETTYYVGMGMVNMVGQESSFVPTLGNGPPINDYLPVTSWLEGVVYVLDGHRISRKIIILTAANKDGGAHVDKKLTEEYELLKRECGIGKLIYHENGNHTEQLLDNAHYVSLRQMAYEILNSPELTKFAELD